MLSRLWRQQPGDATNGNTSRQDKIDFRRIILDYATTQNLTLSLALENENRRSNVYLADYEYYQVSLRLFGKI